MTTIKGIMKPILFYAGLPGSKIRWRRLTGQSNIFIIMYHKIDYDASPLFGASVNPDVFERHISQLSKNYEIIDLNDINKSWSSRSSRKINKDFVILTFDDGYRNNYIHAFPVLKKYRVPATIFLATGFIGTDRLLWHDEIAWILYNAASVPEIAALAKHNIYQDITDDLLLFYNCDKSEQVKILFSIVAKLKCLSIEERIRMIKGLAKVCKVNIWPGKSSRAMLSWDEVVEMSDNGISFGSHTVSHPVMSSVSASNARSEIVTSKKIIEGYIQKSVTTFAYPYGKRDDFTNETVKILSDEGFECACSTVWGTEQYPIKEPLALKRMGASPDPYLFL